MASWFASPPRVPKSARPSLTFFFLLEGAFLLTLVPHVVELPLWLTISIAVALIIRSFMEVYRLPLPSTTFCALVALCLLFGVLLQYHTVAGRDAGLALIAGLLAIKFFELRSPRDTAVTIFSGFFVVMCALLYSQVIELFVYCLIMMWLLTGLLRRLQIGDQPEDHLLPMLRWAGIVFLQALPLTIFLFFFFPRYQGKLQISLGETSLGFSDTVKPGDIASLSKNDAEAMYVRFTSGPIPGNESMYWRGLVLWHFEDGTWTAGKLAEVPVSKGEEPMPAHDSDKIEQVITLNPHYQRWLFALDYPVTGADNPSEPQPWSIVRNGDILQLLDDKGKVDHKERYTVLSSFALNPQILTEDEAKEGTLLPGDNPKDNPDYAIAPDIRELAAKLHRENPEEKAFVYAVLRYFRQQHFIYTANPGVQAGHGQWLHDFLFTTKAGFCEHYATAFAVLMRAEHIPARLVLGFQGANYNPYKDIYTVQQSNAHAWDEVWFDAREQTVPGKRMGNWVRVDPTAILPPGEAAAQGQNSTNPGQQDSGDELSNQVAQHQLTFLETYFPSWVHRGVVEFQLRREQMEADWDDLVFSYDPETQSSLAEALGLGRNPAFQLGLICLAFLGICVLVLRHWIKPRATVSPVENLYASFCRSMAQRGVPRATWEGPLAYTERVAEAFPEKERAIRDVGSIVARARYGPVPPGADTHAELKSLLLVITASQAASSSREKI